MHWYNDTTSQSDGIIRSYLHMSQEKAITDIHDYTHYNNDARGDGSWRQG